MPPPKRAEVSTTREFSLWLCCLSIDRRLEGGAIDCQRAVASETLGFTVGMTMLAHARYEARHERHTGFRQVRQAMNFAPICGGPYARAELTRDTINSPVDDTRKLTRNERRLGYGVRIPAGPYVDFDYVNEKQHSRGKSRLTHQIELGCETPGLRGSYAIAKEMERSGNQITKNEQTTTTEANIRTSGISGTVIRSTKKDLLHPIPPTGTDLSGEPHDSPEQTVTSAVATNDQPQSTPESVSIPVASDVQDDLPTFRSHHRYIALGILSRKTGLAREKITTRLETQKSHDPLFSSIRKSSWKLWPLHKRLFSLKHISGFGLYHCHVDSGYHSPVDVDDRTKQTLFEFYLDYKHSPPGMDHQWLEWIHEHLNSGDADPRNGKYTLELQLRWSITKILIYGLLPVLGSLVVGVAYMQVRMRRADDFGAQLSVVQTAWGIASYVVGAAGGKMYSMRGKERLMVWRQLHLLSWVSLHSLRMRRATGEFGFFSDFWLFAHWLWHSSRNVISFAISLAFLSFPYFKGMCRKQILSAGFELVVMTERLKEVKKI